MRGTAGIPTVEVLVAGVPDIPAHHLLLRGLPDRPSSIAPRLEVTGTLVHMGWRPRHRSPESAAASQQPCVGQPDTLRSTSSARHERIT
jgi:hypothetical protein